MDSNNNSNIDEKLDVEVLADLETKIESEFNKPNTNTSKFSKAKDWIKTAYTEEWASMPSHLLGAGTSMYGTNEVTKWITPKTDSDILITAISTISDLAIYWGTFTPTKLINERKDMKDENGKYTKELVKEKVKEFVKLVGVVEVAYTAYRSITQYVLQKNGIDPVNASLTVQGIATGFFTVAYPLIAKGSKELDLKPAINYIKDKYHSILKKVIQT